MANLIKFVHMNYKLINIDDITFFKGIIGDDYVYSDEINLVKYSHDETEDLKYSPEVVLRPNNTIEISKILIYCNSHLISVIFISLLYTEELILNSTFSGMICFVP